MRPSNDRASTARLLVGSSAVLATIAGAVPTYGQVVIDGISFQDRAAQGSIKLGNYRGSLGAIDYDSDGFFDLVVGDDKVVSHRLFHNVPDPLIPGARTFVDVSIGSGLDDADGKLRAGGGVAVADYDNDGDPDIYFAGFEFANPINSGLLYRNDGGGQFTNVSIASGVRVTGKIPESVSWNDFDHDGWLDLMIFNLAGSDRTLTLLRNNADGTFSDASSLTPALPPTGHSYGHVWSDVDQDGWADAVFIQNNGQPSLLRNVPAPGGGRQFIDIAAAAGYTSLGPAPMGIAAGDMDNDGDLDFAITDAATGTYYENLGGGKVQRVFPFATFFGWGTTWLDADNDGRLDNYQAGSWVTANPDQLVRNLGGGQWKNVSGALNTSALSSQYTIRMDFNNDGREDLFTINPGVPGQFISVYENTSPVPNHWLKIRLVGGGATNRSAIGAVVRATSAAGTQVREIVAGSSQTGTEDPRAHFGLDASTSVSAVAITWPGPGGVAWRTSIHGPFAADQIVTIQAPCPADISDDGELSIDDFIVFQTLFAVGNAQADCDGDGELLIDDFICFQTAFAVGC